MWGYEEEELQILSFLNFALRGDENSASRSSLFTLKEKPPLPTVQEGVWNRE
jgi:hypothetical protein